MNIRKVGIVGAGTMGQGIAETVAGQGFEVILLDKTEYDLEKAKLGLELSLSGQIAHRGISEEEKAQILSRIVLCTNLQVLKECQLVIESVDEHLEDKIDVLQAVEEVVGTEAVIASNTSTLSITELAAHLDHPERVIGIHFQHPVLRSHLIEVVRGLKTAQQTVETTFSFAAALAISAVEVFEAPGYITSRLIMPLINDAVAILAEGVASAVDIDQAMTIGFGFALGPLELADRFGLDRVLGILHALFHETGELRYRPHAHLRKLVRAGRCGIKSREGFFRYDEWGERIAEREKE